MYPDYKEKAIQRLMSGFVNLVGRQDKKPLFDNTGTVALDSDFLSPQYFTTGSVIDIARLLDDIEKPNGWSKSSIRAVYQLAAAAEQQQNGFDDHLLQVMLSIMYNCKDNGSGALCANIDKDSITVNLQEELSDSSVLECLDRVPVSDGKSTAYHRVTTAILKYENDEWVLTFTSIRLDDHKTVELQGDALSSELKKEIADYMIEEARKRPDNVESPLEKIGKDKWVAGRRGIVTIDREDVLTAITEITDCNILEVEVGTNGHQGGDSGYGCRTYLRITDKASTDISCKVDGDIYNRPSQIEIMLGGDAELSTFTKALRFAADVLEKQMNGQMSTDVPKKLDAEKISNDDR